MAVETSLAEARRWLATDECRLVLSEFRDRRGRPLEDSLTALGVDAAAYLRLIQFVEGDGEPQCRSRTQAFTVPGSRVVFVCGRNFEYGWRSDKMKATATMLHEALHSLGLGENPPTSAAITRRVIALCAKD